MTEESKTELAEDEALLSLRVLREKQRQAVRVEIKGSRRLKMAIVLALVFYMVAVAGTVMVVSNQHAKQLHEAKRQTTTLHPPDLSAIYKGVMAWNVSYEADVPAINCLGSFSGVGHVVDRWTFDRSSGTLSCNGEVLAKGVEEMTIVLDPDKASGHKSAPEGQSRINGAVERDGAGRNMRVIYAVFVSWAKLIKPNEKVMVRADDLSATF
jgi:hypothetical protein